MIELSLCFHRDRLTPVLRLFALTFEVVAKAKFLAIWLLIKTKLP